MLTENFGYSMELIYVAVTREKGISRHHFRVKAAHCPNVHCLAISLITNKKFRRSIPPCRYVIRERLVGGVYETCTPKVAEFHHAVRRYQNVLRLDIAMHYLNECFFFLISIKVKPGFKKFISIGTLLHEEKPERSLESFSDSHIWKRKGVDSQRKIEKERKATSLCIAAL